MVWLNRVPLLTRFFGRVTELASLEQLLEHRRIVTLVGPPGTGKTRLALEACQGSASYDQVWFCDLSRAPTGQDIEAVIARALDLMSSGEVDLGDVIARDIDQRGRVLLVLDNAEHVIEATAQAVTRLFAEAPDCSLLVTSREAMRIAGEALLEVGPLDLAGPAVDLFVDRARDVRPGYDPGPDELALVRRVVTLLEGIPLAIELAAGRLRAMGASDLLERLPGQLEILSDRTRGPHHRQATLRAAIDWSWALLSPAEKGALAQSSVFAGSFDLVAAERVLLLGADESVLDTIQSLVDKSLLRIADSGSGVVRYGLLASIREYGAERLAESGAAAATLARQAAHFLGRAALHGDQFHVGAPRDVTGDFDDLLAIHQRSLAARDTAAALSAALALDPFFEARGPAEQRLRLLDGALRLAAEHPPVEDEAQGHLARAHLARAHAILLTGRTAESRADATSAAALALELEDAELAGRAKMILGYLLGMEGRDREGVVHLEAAASQLAGVAPTLQGVALVWLAEAENRLGETVSAHIHYDEAVRRVSTTGGKGLAHRAYNALGAVAMRLGRLDDGRRFLARALELTRQARDRATEARILYNLALTELDSHQISPAADFAQASLAIEGDLAIQMVSSSTLLVLGVCHEERGMSDDAEACYREALAIAMARGLTRFEVPVQMRLGALEARRGRLEVARALLDAAHERASADGEDGLLAAVEAHRGVLDIALSVDARSAGDLEGALAHRAKAEGRLDSARRFASQELLVRIGVRELERALAASETTRPPPAAAERPASTVVLSFSIGADCRWFQQSDADPVSLERRKTLRLLLARLLVGKDSAPGLAVPVADLFRAAWPASPTDAEQAGRRVHTAVWTLRRLGLRELIVTADDGYYLLPGAVIERERQRP